MQHINPVRRHKEKFLKIAQGLRLWVLEMLAWMLAGIDCRETKLWLQGELRDARRDIRALIVALVACELWRPVKRTRWRRPPSVRKGQRYARRRRRIHHAFTGGIRLRTLADMKRVLDDLDGAVAHGLRKVRRPRTAGTLVPVRPVAIVHVCGAPLPACDSADTS